MYMKYKIIVKAVIFDKETKKVLLLKRSPNDTVDPNSWENAGGKLMLGETPEKALTREVYEECGLDISINSILYAVTVNRKEPSVIIAYLCNPLTYNVVLSEEHQDSYWANEKEYEKMLSAHILNDFRQHNVHKKIWKDNGVGENE